MAETVVVATEEDAGFRFSWGLAIAGGVVATAVTFFLLVLGSGFGLLIVNPIRHTGPSLPAFLTGGAIYFLAAQAFGFAVGGHLAGRLLGLTAETRGQEEFRAAAHGLVAWAITILVTLALVVLAGVAAVGGGTAVTALYGARSLHSAAIASPDYLVDVLFRPAHATPGAEADVTGAPAAAQPADTGAHAEADRILQAGLLRREVLTRDDRARLIELVVTQAGISSDEATSRVDRMQHDVQEKTRRAADIARKAASYASLWIALSLLFGAVVAMFAAVSACLEDDRVT